VWEEAAVAVVGKVVDMLTVLTVFSNRSEGGQTVERRCVMGSFLPPERSLYLPSKFDKFPVLVQLWVK
jgi:hypothetical protein